MIWAIPNISGRAPQSRINHKANVIGKYMVISFGKYKFYTYYLFIDTGRPVQTKIPTSSSSV